MNSKVKTYLLSIGMKKPLIERVGQICDRFSQLAKFEIDDVFISEYVLDNGTRAYEDIRIFTHGMIVEADQFQAQDTFYFNPIDKSQRISWEVSFKDYDFKSATADSRLTVTIHTGLNTVRFKASRENCGVLSEIIRRYLPEPNSIPDP